MTLLDRNPKFTEYFSCLCMNKMALASKESAIQYALNVHFPIISVLGVIFHPLFLDCTTLGEEKKLKSYVEENSRIILRLFRYSGDYCKME